MDKVLDVIIDYSASKRIELLFLEIHLLEQLRLNKFFIIITDNDLRFKPGNSGIISNSPDTL